MADTPTQSSATDMRDILSKVLIDGQNQIHDLKDGKATPEEITERMFASLDYWTPIAEAYAAEKVQAELESLLHEGVCEYMIGWAKVCEKQDDCPKIRSRIARLTHQGQNTEGDKSCE